MKMESVMPGGLKAVGVPCWCRNNKGGILCTI
jgi:hypothetical protein